MPRTAVLLIDIQRAFVTGDTAPPRGGEVLAVARRLADRARQQGLMVLHVQNDGAPGSEDAAGTPGWQLAIEPSGEDFVIRKAVDDSFDGTTLAEVLRRNGVDRLVIAGMLSEMCVAATARSALARGFEVWLPHDAHATYDTPSAEWHPDIVPAEAVSRVAEWSLGDEIHLVAHAEQIDLSS